ncbi:hypothetical protein ACFCX4_32880 [Kitasatospora sp. NPDC056327]|uniref:hypothetical protein n=1 Tax=Kitasatospora sp. NPDC056327 TaxID=3345785 RepID=UPI0035E1203C
MRYERELTNSRFIARVTGADDKESLPMRIFAKAGRTAAAALIGATLSAGVVGLGAGSAAAAPLDYTTPINTPTWAQGKSYNSAVGGSQIGILVASSSTYSYCQAKGDSYSDLGYSNNWWVNTDDDSGHLRAWVSAVYFSGGPNWGPIPNLPYCWPGGNNPAG